MVSYYRALRKRQYIMVLILYGKLVVDYIVILSDVVYDEIHSLYEHFSTKTQGYGRDRVSTRPSGMFVDVML